MRGRIISRDIFPIASVVLLVLGGILFAQEESSKTPATAAGEPAETVYNVGKDGVTAPRVMYAPNAEYSDQARRERLQGTVGLILVVSSNGKPKEIRVSRSVGSGLEEK